MYYIYLQAFYHLNIPCSSAALWW